MSTRRSVLSTKYTGNNGEGEESTATSKGNRQLPYDPFQRRPLRLKALRGEPGRTDVQGQAKQHGDPEEQETSKKPLTGTDPPARGCRRLLLCWAGHTFLQGLEISSFVTYC